VAEGRGGGDDEGGAAKASTVNAGWTGLGLGQGVGEGGGVGGVQPDNQINRPTIRSWRSLKFIILPSVIQDKGRVKLIKLSEVA
jgi:hypothetical protein